VVSLAPCISRLGLSIDKVCIVFCCSRSIYPLFHLSCYHMDVMLPFSMLFLSFLLFLPYSAALNLSTPNISTNLSVTNAILQGATNSTDTPLAVAFSCYGLPYGGFGFASHVLTTYTIIILAFDRRPLLPFRRLRHRKFDMLLLAGQLIGTLITTIYTMVKCRGLWELAAIAAWQLSICLAQTCASMVSNATTWFEIEHRPWNHWWLLALYVPGFCVGIVGLIGTFDHLLTGPHINLIVFWLPLVLVSLVAGVSVAICCPPWSRRRFGTAPDPEEYPEDCIEGIFHFRWFKRHPEWLYRLPAGVCLVFSLLAPFAADWVLGSLLNNLAGIGYGKLAKVSYTYFVAKRLLMLSC
jgi:hypothetical protein